MPEEPPRVRAVPATTARCHGYAHGCRCPACRERAQVVAEHIAAGRAPYTVTGKLRKPPARKSKHAQPWQPGPPRSRSE